MGERVRTFHASGGRCLTPLRCAGGSLIARATLHTPATRGVARGRRVPIFIITFSRKSQVTFAHVTNAPRGG